MNDLATLAETIKLDTQVVQYSPLFKVKVTEHIRLLRGRNQAHLAGGEDADTTRTNYMARWRPLNEACGTRWSEALNPAFPAWTEPTDDPAQCFSVEASGKGSPSSCFGFNLVTGELLEYLAGGRFQDVANRCDSHPCLLFDLWCNHTDARGAVVQMIQRRKLSVYFFDNDGTFLKRAR